MPTLSENLICIERLKGQFALYEFFSQTCSVKVAVLKIFQNSLENRRVRSKGLPYRSFARILGIFFNCFTEHLSMANFIKVSLDTGIAIFSNEEENSNLLKDLN